MHQRSQTSLAAKAVAALASVLFLSVTTMPQGEPAYRNAKLPVEQRVADLLSRMTLEEKVAARRHVAKPGFRQRSAANAHR